ncbi:MAG: sulfatase-like hydrolase/transferase [Gemmatales bacterium]|nr:sulfatase-like hydrolase/transferase [Gemmatales bacterium]MDW7994488.1 sulfatase-like hydrolase/transferase [Gemmatales bacterium]
MYQTSMDTHHLQGHRNDDFRLLARIRPLTHWLRDAGYFTANVVKIGDRVVGTGKLDLNFVNEGPIFQSDDWSALRKHQPFFAHINTPEVEYDIYDRKTRFKTRVEWVGEREHPRIATPDKVQPPPYYPDHPIVREEWARYLNSVSGLDRRVGWILEALERYDLLEDTVIMSFAANGRLEPRGIHWCYAPGIHVPLIIRWPKNYPPPPQFKPGMTSDQIISLLDLTATTLGIAGIRKPPLMQSRVFLGSACDPPRSFAFSARDRIDETVNRIRSVHDGRFHYIRNFMPEQSFTSLNRYKEKCFLIMQVLRDLHGKGLLSGPPLTLMAARLPEEELYDTLTDPHEIRNLAQSRDPEHQAALMRLRTALEVWIVETGDLGARPESPEIIAE